MGIKSAWQHVPWGERIVVKDAEAEALTVFHPVSLGERTDEKGWWLYRATSG